MSDNDSLRRLTDLEDALAALRHDLRGMLSPALLVADRLLAHPDPKVVRAGETVVKAIRRAEARLLEARLLETRQASASASDGAGGGGTA